MSIAIEVTKPAKPVILTDRAEPAVKPKEVTIDPNRRLQSDTIDIVGLYEMAAERIESMRDTLKQVAIANKAKYIDGNSYSVGELRQGNVATGINPKKFVELCWKRKIPSEKIYSALSVVKKRAELVLSGDDLESTMDTASAKSPSLYVLAKKDAEQPSVSEALFMVSEFFREEAEAAKEVEMAGVVGAVSVNGNNGTIN